MGSQELILKLENEADTKAVVNVETFLEDQGVYWASLESPSEYAAVLERVYPPAPEDEEALVEPEPFVEKREEERLYRVLGIMSPDVPGFKCVTFDVSLKGLRLSVDQELPVGRSIRFRLDLDDHRVEPLEMRGEVLWTKERPPKGYWLGIRYQNPSEDHLEKISKFIEDSRSIEHGTITRDYAAD